MTSPIALPDQVLAIANIIAEYLCDLLVDLNVPARRCCLAQGTPPPMDSCCREPDPDGGPDLEGFAWVTIGGDYPVDAQFPGQLARPAKCPNGLAQTYTVGIYRCAPTIDDQGNIPTCDEVYAAIERQTQDGAIIRRAIRCSLDAAAKPHVMRLGGPVNPRGGCMGWSQEVVVHIDDCISCTPIPGGESS